MSAASERRRTISVPDVVDHIKERLADWGVSDEDVLWAIQKGAAQPNSPRAKSLMAAAQYGGSRLVPYDDEWVAKGNDAVINAIIELETEIVGKAELAAQLAAEPLTMRLARLGSQMREDEHKVLIADAVEALFGLAPTEPIAGSVTAQPVTPGTDEYAESPAEEDARLNREADVRQADVERRMTALIAEGVGDTFSSMLDLLLDMKVDGYTPAERRADVLTAVLGIIANRDLDREAAQLSGN